MALDVLHNDIWLENILNYVSLYEVEVLTRVSKEMRALCYTFFTRPSRPWTRDRLRALIDPMPTKSSLNYVRIHSTFGTFLCTIPGTGVFTLAIGARYSLQFRPLLTWCCEMDLTRICDYGQTIEEVHVSPRLEPVLRVVVTRINAAEALDACTRREEEEGPVRKKRRLE